MPEVTFTIRWPDGEVQPCYSPSRAIEDTLTPGAVYPTAEFLRRTGDALEEASERVRAKFGFACTAAAAQLEELATAAARHAPHLTGCVTVEAMEIRGAPRTAPPPADDLEGHVPVVVVGGGQAGLSVSWYLRRQGVEHLVLERHRVADQWRTARWDAFCLVTPNWQCTLPGHPYDGDDPDGFMLRDDVVAYVEAFAARHDLPVCEGVDVLAVRPGDEGGFVVETTSGTVTTDQVVLAVGGYHRPRIPALAARIPDDVTQLHSSQYKRPSSLPDGGVLVVGSGQSGAQIAEDLHLGGRRVHLAVGSAPRVSRFYRGRDVVAWLHDMGHYDVPIDDHPMGLQARREANHYVTGRDGGRDIDLRRFAMEGMRLHGRLLGADDGVLRFADDLGANLDHADKVAERAKDGIDRWILEQGIDAPVEARYRPVWRPTRSGPSRVDLDGDDVRTVIWATGFSSDWSWVHLPAFDGTGYPTHTRGVTTVPGLYVLGLPWLSTWGSGRFAGIARDAEHVAAHLVGQRTAAPAAA